jgi:hypothetical protein
MPLPSANPNMGVIIILVGREKIGRTGDRTRDIEGRATTTLPSRSVEESSTPTILGTALGVSYVSGVGPWDLCISKLRMQTY